MGWLSHIWCVFCHWAAKSHILVAVVARSKVLFALLEPSRPADLLPPPPGKRRKQFWQAPAVQKRFFWRPIQLPLNLQKQPADQRLCTCDQCLLLLARNYWLVVQDMRAESSYCWDLCNSSEQELVASLEVEGWCWKSAWVSCCSFGCGICSAACVAFQKS